MENLARIVVFKDSYSDPSRQVAFLHKHGAKITQVLGIINAVAVELTADQESQLVKAREVVTRIDTNEWIVRAL